MLNDQSTAYIPDDPNELMSFDSVFDSEAVKNRRYFPAILANVDLVLEAAECTLLFCGAATKPKRRCAEDCGETGTDDP
jgi:hypothetical protein